MPLGGAGIQTAGLLPQAHSIGIGGYQAWGRSESCWLTITRSFGPGCGSFWSKPDFKVVAAASTGHEAVELVSKHHPDVAVLDIGMPQLNGIEATQQIAANEPRTQVVILSMHADEAYVLRALKAGARAYILKNSAEADLIRAVRTVAEGKSFFSPAGDAPHPDTIPPASTAATRSANSNSRWPPTN